MKDENLLGPWVRRFFLLEHLVAERNLSRNTQASYRDTLMLLLPFAKQGGRQPHWIECNDCRGFDASNRPQVSLPCGEHSTMQWCHPEPKAGQHTFAGQVHRHAFAGSPGLVY